MVPEALLHPADIGAPQAGLAETAAAAVAACGADIRALLWSNVVLVGACRTMRDDVACEFCTGGGLT
jgi:hypothetical protein